MFQNSNKFTVVFLLNFSSSLLKNLKNISRNHPSMDNPIRFLKIEFALLLNKYAPKKRLIGLK